MLPIQIFDWHSDFQLFFSQGSRQISVASKHFEEELATSTLAREHWLSHSRLLRVGAGRPIRILLPSLARNVLNNFMHTSMRGSALTAVRDKDLPRLQKPIICKA